MRQDCVRTVSGKLKTLVNIALFLPIPRRLPGKYVLRLTVVGICLYVSSASDATARVVCCVCVAGRSLGVFALSAERQKLKKNTHINTLVKSASRTVL